MLVADLINECILNDESGWQFKSHTLKPVFVSHEAPLGHFAAKKNLGCLRAFTANHSSIF